MKLKDWFNKWMAGKIQINITYITEGVNPSTTPRVEEKPAVVNITRKSDYRFKAQESIEPDGSSRTYYFTEVYRKGDWYSVENSFFADKDKAMDAHLKLLNGADLKTKKVETVLWEGLSKEEASTWVEIQKANAPA